MVRIRMRFAPGGPRDTAEGGERRISLSPVGHLDTLTAAREMEPSIGMALDEGK